MKVTLINEPNKKLNAFQQVLINRGIKKEELEKYLKTSIETDVNPPSAFGEENLKAGLVLLLQHISKNDDILVIVD